MKKLLRVPTREDFEYPYPSSGFYIAKHHIALEKWAKEAKEHIRKLEHHRDTTVGLWATDRPDLINDPKNIMFELKE